MSDAKDRRKYNRFKIEDGAYAIISHDVSRLGHIIDISKKGISFSYLGSDTIEQNEIDIDIFMYHHNYYLDKVPSKVVSNFRITNDSLFNFVTLMRCCLEFKDMPEDKQAEVEYLIKTFSTSES